MSVIDIMADDSLRTFQLVILHAPHDTQHLFGDILSFMNAFSNKHKLGHLELELLPYTSSFCDLKINIKCYLLASTGKIILI